MVNDATSKMSTSSYFLRSKIYYLKFKVCSKSNFFKFDQVGRKIYIYNTKISLTYIFIIYIFDVVDINNLFLKKGQFFIFYFAIKPQIY